MRHSLLLPLRSSQWQVLQGIDPLFCLRSCPDHHKFFDSGSDKHVLGEQKHPGARLCRHKGRETRRHRMVIVRDQNPALLRRLAKTSGSGRPRSPASSAVWKSIAGSRRCTATMMM
jgi:hypothetical protein